MHTPAHLMIFYVYDEAFLLHIFRLELLHALGFDGILKFQSDIGMNVMSFKNNLI